MVPRPLYSPHNGGIKPLLRIVCAQGQSGAAERINLGRCNLVTTQIGPFAQSAGATRALRTSAKWFIGERLVPTPSSVVVCATTKVIEEQLWAIHEANIQDLFEIYEQLKNHKRRRN